MSDFKVKIIGEVDLEKAEKDLKSFTEKNHKVEIEADTSKLDKKIKNSKDIDIKTKVTGQENISKLNKGLNGAHKASNSLLSSFKNIAKVGVQFNLFHEIEQQARKAVKAVKDIDDAIVSLQMATNQSYSSMRTLMSDYNTMAKDLGAATTEIASGADNWLRQGKSIAETNKLLKDSMVLSKVANITPETSTKQLTAMMKGYKKNVDEVSSINDALTSIDLAAAVDAGGLAEATSRVAASADLAGVSLNKLLGYEAAVGEASQESMSVIGNSFKTIFSRMSEVKAGKLEFVDEDGTVETLSDVELVLKNAGIQLRNSANDFRDFDEVLDETASKWDKLSSVQKAAVSKAFAGQRQSNRFQLLMESYDKALEYEKIANESKGMAESKFEENYLNSLEAKQKSLQASFESLAINTISRDSYAGVIEATESLVEFLDKTNLVKGALTGLAVGGLTKGFISIATGFTNATMHMQNFQKALDLLKSGNLGTAGFDKLINYTDGLSKSQLKAILSSNQLTNAQRIQILTASGMDEATARATLATMGLSAANTTATGTTLSFGTALKGLWSTLLANPIMLVGMAVTAGVSVWQSYKQSVEEAVSSAKSAGQSFSENTSSLNTQIAKVYELKTALASGVLSEQESAQAKSQLLEIQKELNDTYGTQASNIDLVNGSLKEQIALMNDIAVQESNKYLNENKTGIDKATDAMEKKRNAYLGQFSPDTEEGKELDKLLEKYKKLGITKQKQSDGSYTIHFKGDATQAENTLNSFLTDLRKLADENGGDYGYLDGVVEYTSGELESAKKVIDEYSEIYNASLQADMISKGFSKDSPATIYKEYGEAIEKYNDALKSGDTSQIDKAKASFDKVQDSVDGVLKQYPEYESLFDDLENSLNKPAILAQEFDKALKDDEFENALQHIKELKDVDLKGMNFNDDVTSDAETALKNVIDKAIELGIVSDDSADSISTVVDLLVDMGLTGSQSTESLSQSFEKANTSIQTSIANLTKLKEISDESMSGTGLSSDNLTLFREMFGTDAESALERTANGYHLNKKALSDLQKQQEQLSKSDYFNALSEQYTALRDVESQLATAELFEKDTSGLEASRDEIVNNISVLQDLQYQYEAATSAYQEWINAQSSGNERDMYEGIQGGYEKVKDLINRGWADSDEVRTYVDLLSSQDLSTAPVEEVINAYERLSETIGNSGYSILDFFTVDENGNSTTEGIYNFFDTVNSVLGEEYAKLEDGKYQFDFGEGRDKEVADALGMDVEALQSVLRAASEAGFEINLDQPLQSIDELKEKAESAKESLSDMQVDLNVDTFEEVDGQIQSVQAYIDELNEADISPDVRADKLEEANSILEYLLSRKQELGESEGIDVAISVDESQLNEGYAVLADLKGNLENLQGSVGLDYQGFQAGIDNCVAKIEAMSPEMKVALGIQGMSIEEIKTGLTDGSIKIPVSADTSQASTDVQNVDNQTISQKSFTVTANTLQATLALASVKSSLSNIKSKTVTVTVNKKENDSSGGVSGKHKLSGTAHASGIWGTPKTETALVGERNPEIVVNPHTGRWYTVGDNGAEFVELPQGAIVFNDVQSKALLENGKINGRGKALVSGNAYSSGSGGIKRPSSSSYSKKKKSSSSKSKSSSKSSSSSKSKSNAEKSAEDLMDWIAILLERVARQTEIAVDAIDNAIGLVNKQTATAKAISKVQNEISTNQQAYNKYMAQANSVGLSSSYASQVRNGTLKIENIKDENLKTKIEDYKKWYENAIKCEDEIRKLKEQEQELAKRRLENIEDWYDAITDINKAMIDVTDSKQELNEALGTAINLDINVNAVKDSIKAQTDTYNKLVQKLADYQKEFNSQVSSGTIKKNSDAWLEGQKKINEFTADVNEAAKELIEFKDKLQEIEYDTIQNLIDGFDRAVSKLEAKIELMESRDETVPESLYTEQMDNNNARIEEIKKLRDKKLDEQKYYDVDSERYQELAEEINDLDEETYQLLTDNEKLKDSIFELRFTPIDEALEKYQNLRKELDSFYNLLNEEAFFDKNGGITEDGLAGLALIQQGMATAKKEIADYTTGLNKLQESLDNGVISQKEFDEKSEEYRQGLQDAVANVEDYKNSIEDLYMTQLKTEVDALDEIIEKRKEALRRKEEYYNYDKKIKKQSKDVDMLRSQIQALSGVNNATAIAQRKKLEQELKDAEEELNETKREHALEMQEQGYDKTSEEMHDMLEQVEYDLVHSLEKQSQVLESYLSKVVGNYKTAFDKINQIIGNTGWVGSNDFNQNQSQLGTQNGALSQNNNATQSQSEANKNPSSSASGTVTDKIDNNDKFNQGFEQELDKKPNIDNRPVAELKVSPTSIVLEEGKSTSIKTSIRPNDAKNKTLAWKSSDTSIATVSGGTVKAIKHGSCKITASTTDGSGISQTVGVTVNKKPDPSKPKPTTKPNSNGDGVPKVGDRVTFTGRYYYDSWGKRPLGTKYSGVANGVIIDGYSASKYGGNAKRTGDFDVHIKSADGKYKDLGWVKLSQISGYARGTTSTGVTRNQLAWTQENGRELIYRKSDNALLTDLGKGDVVFNHDMTENLMSWGRINPNQTLPIGASNIPVRESNITLEQNIGSLLTVEGNVDKDALPSLETILEKSCKYTMGYFKTELRKTGFRR